MQTLKAFANQAKMTDEKWQELKNAEDKAPYFKALGRTKRALNRRHVFVGTLRGKRDALRHQYEFLSIDDFKELEPDYRSWKIEQDVWQNPTQRIVALGSAANVYVY